MIFKKNISILTSLLIFTSYYLHAPLTKEESIHARQQEIQKNWSSFSKKEKKHIASLVNLFNSMLKLKENSINQELIDEIKHKIINIKNENIFSAQTIDGKTFLMLAAIIGNRELCELLLKKNPDCNAFDIKGMSALMYAINENALYAKDEIVKMLLKSGADSLSKNNEGFSALKLAKTNNNRDIIRIIRDDLATKLEHKNNTKALDESYQKLLKAANLDFKKLAQELDVIDPDWNASWTDEDEQRFFNLNKN